MDMVARLRGYQNGVHGQFFLDVAAEIERLRAANSPCPCSDLSNSKNDAESCREALDRARKILDGLEKIYSDEFLKLAEKSDDADGDAFKYIYANQAIGVDKALDVLKGIRQLAQL
jgi:hypothetical protein